VAKALTLEEIREAVENLADADGEVGENVGQWLAKASPLLKGYLQKRAGVRLDFWGRFGEGPGFHQRMFFYRSPGRLRLQTKRRTKFRERDDVLRGAYEMELPVLIDVVKSVEATEPIANAAPLIVPSYVWLEVMEGPQVSLTEALDSPDVVGVSARPSVDRELSPSTGPARQFSPEAPDMQLIDQIVQRRSQVEEDLPSLECPVRLNAGQLIDIEAILKSRPVRLGPDGPELVAWEDLGNFCTEFFQLSAAPPKLCERTGKAGGTLSAHR